MSYIEPGRSLVEDLAHWYLGSEIFHKSSSLLIRQVVFKVFVYLYSLRYAEFLIVVTAGPERGH